MAIPKKFFHDHLVLLLLSINAFLALFGSILVLLRLSSSHGSNGYIVQYRSNFGVNTFTNGGVIELLSFIGFMLLVLTIHTMLGIRVYKINRQATIAILSLGILLLLLAIIISNALILLR